MRYGNFAAPAALPIPPLPRGVVPATDIALPIVLLRGATDLAPSLRRALAGAVPVAPVASAADDDPGPATGAHEHSMTAHGDERSPSRTGRECPRPATLLRADVAVRRVVCRRKLGGLPHRVPGFRPVRAWWSRHLV